MMDHAVTSGPLASTSQGIRLQSVVLPSASPATGRADYRDNLKCEYCRALSYECNGQTPCNVCRSHDRRCKYTPQQASSAGHRGIPRCDPCRLKNLKCNRQMPVCDNCQGESEGQCIYTPKMRASVSSGDVFVSGFVAPSAGSRSDSRKAEYRTASMSSYDRAVMEDGSRTTMARFINTSSGSVSLAPPVRLWHHPAFMPLPGVVSSFLSRVNAAEMLSRDLWDQSLSSFLRSLMPEIRDIACFSPETYSDMVKAIISGDRTKLSTNVDRWMTCHPLRVGSKETNFLIIPRDEVYQSTMEPQLLKDYRVQADHAKRHGRAPINFEPGPSSPCQAFTWIPIKEQIYDILAYAHREHSNSFDMMKDVERLLVATITWPMAEMFCQICPVCTIQHNGQIDR